jgi:hypothetical protein
VATGTRVELVAADGELKLVDTRDWKRVLGPIIAVR